MTDKNTLAYIAKEIAWDQKDEDRRREKQSWHDEFATLGFFQRICKMIGNLTNEELTVLTKLLKEKDSKAVEQHYASGGYWQFGYDKMYEALLEHPVCKKVCEKNKYKCWEELINRYCMLDK